MLLYGSCFSDLYMDDITYEFAGLSQRFKANSIDPVCRFVFIFMILLYEKLMFLCHLPKGSVSDRDLSCLSVRLFVRLSVSHTWLPVISKPFMIGV